MHKLFYTGCIVFLLVCRNAAAQPLVKTYGVQINVTDMGKAIDFYDKILGFKIAKGNAYTNAVLLQPGTGSDVIILNKVAYLLPVAPNEATATLTLQVNNLDSTIARLRGKGIDFKGYQKRKEGVGYAMFLDDPFGTRLSMMEETVVSNPHFDEPRVYNYGFYIPDMDIAKEFFTAGLGFVIRSEKYLPLDLPLGHTDKSFAFMLHTRNGVEAVHYNTAGNEHIVILFSCSDIHKTIETLKEKKVKLANNTTEDLLLGKSVSFYDPFGYISKIIQPEINIVNEDRH